MKAAVLTHRLWYNMDQSRIASPNLGCKENCFCIKSCIAPKLNFCIYSNTIRLPLLSLLYFVVTGTTMYAFLIHLLNRCCIYFVLANEIFCRTGKEWKCLRRASRNANLQTIITCKITTYYNVWQSVYLMVLHLPVFLCLIIRAYTVISSSRSWRQLEKCFDVNNSYGAEHELMHHQDQF